jgi:hypothetical protein
MGPRICCETECLAHNAPKWNALLSIRWDQSTPHLNLLAPHQLGGPEPLLPSCPATYMRGIYIASSQSPFVHHFCPCGSHRHTSPSQVHRDAYTTTLSIIQYGIHRRSFHGLRPFDVWGMLFDTGGMHVAAAHLVSLL